MVLSSNGSESSGDALMFIVKYFARPSGVLEGRINCQGKLLDGEKEVWNDARSMIFAHAFLATIIRHLTRAINALSFDDNL